MPIRYLFIDASYFKVRNDGRYITKALFVAVGKDENGYRQVLGARIADDESEAFWFDFFDHLRERGFRDVKLVISDGHKGIQEAVRSQFLGSSWQMCNVHFLRAVQKNKKKKDKTLIANKLRDASEDQTEMQNIASELIDAGYSKSADTIDRFIFDL